MYSLRPFRFRASPSGPSPTFSVSATFMVSRFSTVTVLSALFALVAYRLGRINRLES